MDYKKAISNFIVSAVKSVYADCDITDVQILVETPPNSAMGEYAFPCFKLSKLTKKPPQVISAALAEDMTNKLAGSSLFFVKKITVESAYVNFSIKEEALAENVVAEILKDPEGFCCSDIGAGKTIVIDYSSPNVAKQFHVGHMRTTIIGDALYRIHKQLGYHCVGINYLGDWGTQFGKLIVAYKNWSSKEAVEKDDIFELTRIYVKFNTEAKTHEDLNDEARAWLLKMQNGDPEALELWTFFSEMSMKEYRRIYELLDVDFDLYQGESFFNDKMQAVVDELIDKNLLIESEGAKVVDLSENKMPPCLILRRDGGTLYPTRDIAAVMHRKKTYDFYKCLYVVAVDQSLHFAQWFKVIELMGYEWSNDLVHIPFGMMNTAAGKIATRNGGEFFLEDLLKEAVSRVKAVIEEKNPELANKDEIARQIGIGAVKFNDLYNTRVKDVLFSWEKMLNFEGETGPYVQYTHARACSIIARSGAERVCEKEIDYNMLTDEFSIAVIKLLSSYPEKIIEAAEKYEPYVIARQLVAISQAFNKFYHENQILNSDEKTREARLALVYCAKNILKNGLAVIGIAAPEKM